MRIYSQAIFALSLGFALACGGGSADMGGADLPQEWVDYGVDVGDGDVFMVTGQSVIVKYPSTTPKVDIAAGWRKPFDDKGWKEIYAGETSGVYTVTLSSDDGKTVAISVLEVMGEHQLSATLPK